MEAGEEADDFNPELFNLPVLECLKSGTLRRIFGEFDRILADNIDLINHLLVMLGYEGGPNTIGPHLVRYENLAKKGRMFFNELITELITNGHVNDLNSLRVLYDRLGGEIRFLSVRKMIIMYQTTILRELRLLNEPVVNEPQLPVRITPIYVVYHPDQTRSFPAAFKFFLDRIKETPNIQLTDVNLSVSTVVDNFIDLIMPKRDGIIIFLYDNFINRILHSNNVTGYDTVKRLYFQAYSEFLDSFENKRFLTVISGQFNEPRFPYPWLLMANNPPIRLFQGDTPNQLDEEMITRETQSLMRLVFNSPLFQAN